MCDSQGAATIATSIIWQIQSAHSRQVQQGTVVPASIELPPPPLAVPPRQPHDSVSQISQGSTIMGGQNEQASLSGRHLQKTKTPASITCSSVVSRYSVGIYFLIATLNGIDIKCADIKNTYPLIGVSSNN